MDTERNFPALGIQPADPATAFLLSHSSLVIEPLVLGVFVSLFP